MTDRRRSGEDPRFAAKRSPPSPVSIVPMEADPSFGSTPSSTSSSYHDPHAPQHLSDERAHHLPPATPPPADVAAVPTKEGPVGAARAPAAVGRLRPPPPETPTKSIPPTTPPSSEESPVASSSLRPPPQRAGGLLLLLTSLNNLVASGLLYIFSSALVLLSAYLQGLQQRTRERLQERLQREKEQEEEERGPLPSMGEPRSRPQHALASRIMAGPHAVAAWSGSVAAAADLVAAILASAWRRRGGLW